MSRAPWHADVDVSPEQLARAIERRFPEFEDPQVVALPAGWDYHTFEVDQDWVFKVPKRQREVSRMRQEVSLLTWLPALPASIPRPTFHGVASADLPVPFFGYPRLDGRFADRGADAEVVVPQLLAFLETLHNVLPPFALDEPSEAPWERQAASLANVVERHPELQPAWAWMRDNRPNAPERKALLHADLGPEHALLAQDADRLVAVIDWGDAFRGDPAFDLMPLLLWVPAITRAAYADRYEDTDVYARGVAYAVRHGLTMLGAYDRWEDPARDRHLAVMQQLQQVIP